MGMSPSRITRVYTAIACFTLTGFMVQPIASAQESPPATTAGGNSALPPGANPTCPVMEGEEVDPDISLDYEGKQVFFCCPKCRIKFRNNPEEYTDILASIIPVALTTQDTHSDGHDSAAETQAQTNTSPDGHTDDHSSEQASALTQALNKLGRNHVVIIHFPIALLITAAAAQAFLYIKPNSTIKPLIAPVYKLGALSAIFAMGLGLALTLGNADTSDWIFWWHRALGIATAVLATSTWALMAKSSKNESNTQLISIAILATGLLAAITGHFGGSLIYGWSYLWS